MSTQPQLSLVENPSYSPSELKQLILATVKPVFYGNGPFANRILSVEGEIANTPSAYGQGIMYFNIKDSAGCSLNVRAMRSAFTFEPGQAKGAKVALSGLIDIQDKQNGADFDIQFKATKVSLLGIGERAQAEKSLFGELQTLGYFTNKAPLPSFEGMESCEIGVVTSPAAGANAFEDIRQTLRDLPFFHLDLIPVSLFDATNIASAIRMADSLGKHLLIVTRGGGERLDVFNERPILDAVFNARTPIISAVGHAKDKTLIDLVADLSAATPTEAAKVLSDNYVAMLAKQEYAKVQSENQRLQRLLSDLNQALAKQSQESTQISRTLTQLQSNRSANDKEMKRLYTELASSRKRLHTLALAAPLVVVFVVILSFLLR